MGQSIQAPAIPSPLVYGSIGIAGLFAVSSVYRALRSERRQPVRVEVLAQPAGEEPGRQAGQASAPEDESIALTRQYSAFTELFDTLPNTVLEETFPMPATSLWEALFGSDIFLARFYARQNYRSLRLAPWEENKRRTIIYVKDIKPTPLAPSEAECIEKYNVVAHTPQGFIVNVAAVTPGVPFGNSFHCQLQFVGEAIDGQSCRLKVKTGVKFTKTNWLRGVISKEAHAGMKETYALFATELQQYVRERFPATTSAAGKGRATKGSPVIVDAASTTSQNQQAKLVKLLLAVVVLLLIAVGVLFAKQLVLEQKIAMLAAALAAQS